MKDSGKNTGYEKRDVNIASILKFGILSIIVIVAVILFTRDYYLSVKEDMIFQMVLEPESLVLNELRKQEMEVIHSYGIIDQKQEKFNIPIEKAMEIIVSESNMDNNNVESE